MFCQSEHFCAFKSNLTFTYNSSTNYAKLCWLRNCFSSAEWVKFRLSIVVWFYIVKKMLQHTSILSVKKKLAEKKKCQTASHHSKNKTDTRCHRSKRPLHTSAEDTSHWSWFSGVHRHSNVSLWPIKGIQANCERVTACESSLRDALHFTTKRQRNN